MTNKKEDLERIKGNKHHIIKIYQKYLQEEEAKDRSPNSKLILDAAHDLALVLLSIESFDSFLKTIDEYSERIQEYFELYRAHDPSKYGARYDSHMKNYQSDPYKLFNLFNIAIIAGNTRLIKLAREEINRVPEQFPLEVRIHADYYYASIWYDRMLDENYEEAQKSSERISERKKPVKHFHALGKAIATKDPQQVEHALHKQLQYHTRRISQGGEVVGVHKYVDELATAFYALARKQGIDISLESIPEKYRELIPQAVIEKYGK